jgi:hypothetical protein
MHAAQNKQWRYLNEAVGYVYSPECDISTGKQLVRTMGSIDHRLWGAKPARVLFWRDHHEPHP